VTRIAFDEADAPVAKVDQVAGKIIGGMSIVRADRQPVRAVSVGRDRHHGDVALGQKIDQFRPVAQRRGQDDTGHMRLRDLIDNLLRGSAGRTLFDHQMQVTLGRFSQSAEQQFAKIGRCGAVTVEQRDAPVGAACQCARGRIGNIAQRLHRARHGLPRAGTDQRLAVYGARCGHDRYAGTGGDILDRGRLAVVSLHRDRSLAILQAKENRP